MIDDRESRSSLYKKCIYISDWLGDLVFEEKKLPEIPIKRKDTLRKKKHIIDIRSLYNRLFEEKSIKRITGFFIFSVILVSIISIVLAILLYILSWILDIMDLWFAIVILSIFSIPIIIVIAYYIAKK